MFNHVMLHPANEVVTFNFGMLRETAWYHLFTVSMFHFICMCRHQRCVLHREERQGSERNSKSHWFTQQGYWACNYRFIEGRGCIIEAHHVYCHCICRKAFGSYWFTGGLLCGEIDMRVLWLNCKRWSKKRDIWWFIYSQYNPFIMIFGLPT